MRIIKEKITKRTGMTEVLRGLKAKSDCLIIDPDERPSVSSIASKLKRTEGMLFITQKDGDVVKVQKIGKVKIKK